MKSEGQGSHVSFWHKEGLIAMSVLVPDCWVKGGRHTTAQNSLSGPRVVGKRQEPCQTLPHSPSCLGFHLVLIFLLVIFVALVDPKEEALSESCRVEAVLPPAPKGLPTQSSPQVPESPGELRSGWRASRGKQRVKPTHALCWSQQPQRQLLSLILPLNCSLVAPGNFKEKKWGN